MEWLRLGGVSVAWLSSTFQSRRGLSSCMQTSPQSKPLIPSLFWVLTCICPFDRSSCVCHGHLKGNMSEVGTPQHASLPFFWSSHTCCLHWNFTQNFFLSHHSPSLSLTVPLHEFPVLVPSLGHQHFLLKLLQYFSNEFPSLWMALLSDSFPRLWAEPFS